MANTIQVTIDLDTGEAVRDLKKIEKKSKTSGKKISKNLKKGTQGLSDSLSALKGPMLALGATFFAAFAGRRIIQAAQAQQDAVNNLAASLRSIGEAGRQAELEQFAASLQKVTVFGDEAIISQLAFAQAMGASASQSKDILEAATDMSAALNIDLNAAVRNISKTLGGFAGELGEVIPELKDLTAEQLKTGLGVELLAAKYKGFAQSEIKTFSGAIAQLENSFGDLLEKMGDVVIKNPAIVDGIKSMKDGIDDLSKNIFKIGQSIVKWVIAPLELLWNISTVVFNVMRIAVQDVVVGFAVLGEGIARLKQLVAGPDSITDAMISFGESSRQVLTDLEADATTSFDNVFNFDVATKADAFLGGLDSAMNKAVKIVDKGTKNMNKAVKGTGDAMNKSLGQGVANAVTTMMSAIANGENALSAFGKSMMNMFGDLAINLGQLFIMEGIAALKMFSFDPTGTIAAGFGLVALGSLLKSIGGGGASTMSSPAETTGGGVAISEKSDAFVANEELKEPNQAVVINVDGTVLDPQSVGLQIAEVLNEAGFGNGAVVA